MLNFPLDYRATKHVAFSGTGNLCAGVQKQIASSADDDYKNVIGVMAKNTNGWYTEALLSDEAQPNPQIIEMSRNARVIVTVNTRESNVVDTQSVRGLVQVYFKTYTGWTNAITIPHPEPDNDYSFWGNSVAISNDGNNLAIMSPTKGIHMFTLGNGTYQYAGKISDGFNTFSRSNTCATQLRFNVAGELFTLESISSTEHTLKRWQLNTGSWTQVSSINLNGISNNLFFYDMAVSGDGSTVAISWQSQSLEEPIAVRIVTFEGTTPTDKGDVNWGNDYLDSWFGTKLALSKDGKLLAASAPGATDGGIVYFFRQTANGGWGLVEQIYTKQEGNTLFGTQMSFDDIGHALVVMSFDDENKPTYEVYHHEDWMSRAITTLYGYRRYDTVPVYSSDTLDGGLGDSMAISPYGNRLIVGAPTDGSENPSQGSAHEFELGEDNVWRLTHTFPLPEGVDTNSNFGYAVAFITNDTEVAISEPFDVVGVPGEIATRKGRVHFYRRSSAGWTLTQTIESPFTLDAFGFSLATKPRGYDPVVSNRNIYRTVVGFTYLAVGAPYLNDKQGAVHIYQRVSEYAPWEFKETLNPTKSITNSYWGGALSMANNNGQSFQLAIGCCNNNASVTTDGWLDIFKLTTSASTIQLDTTLEVPVGYDPVGFGVSVEMKENLLYVGHYSTTIDHSGTIHTYEIAVRK
ncbi:hypothetical protein [Endozoicomonas sp. ONNA1]|uniref:hypothetical protein n=1 Tax=Endozoicomonas sp. ONNA1 TaxID=2828740 RepID=UPI0021481C88|nr:hypothetical protein [Endozoicomonas sp. ONNA1]